MLDLNPKMQEALMLARDGLQLTLEEEARIHLAAERPAYGAPSWRRLLASAFIALARRLDPAAPAATRPTSLARRTA